VAKVDRASFGEFAAQRRLQGFNQHAVSIIIAETDPRLQKSQ
jgi:hypothetical protein